MKKNYVLQFLRFIFCILVVFVHTNMFSPSNPSNYPFCGGYIAVEFFFIVSGYFIMKKISDDKCFDNKEPAKCAIGYSTNKMLKLLPFMFISVMLFYVVRFICRSVRIADIKYSIFEFLGLTMFGFNHNFQVTPLWFVSSLFIATTILIYIALKNKDLFSNILVYFLPLFIYGYLYRNYGHLDLWDTLVLNSKFLLISNLRAIAGVCVGCISYKISEKIKGTEFTKIGLFLITILEVSCFAMVILVAYNKYHSINDYFCVILLLIGVSIVLSSKSYSSKILESFQKVFNFLGNISMPIYISHWFIILLVNIIYTKYSYSEKVFIYVILSLITGISLYYFVGFIMKKMSKIKEFFIKS